MEAWFIYKGNRLVGSKTGYPTKTDAESDIIRKIFPYYLNKKPNKQIEYFYKEFNGPCSKSKWYFNRDKWNNKIWELYRNKHYKIVKKKFKIVFEDGL